MADKAVFQNANGIGYDATTGKFTLSAVFALTDGTTGGSLLLSIGVSSTTFNPLLPSWQQLLRAEIINQANLQYGKTVDQVLFLGAIIVL